MQLKHIEGSDEESEEEAFTEEEVVTPIVPINVPQQDHIAKAEAVARVDDQSGGESLFGDNVSL